MFAGKGRVVPFQYYSAYNLSPHYPNFPDLFSCTVFFHKQIIWKLIQVGKEEAVIIKIKMAAHAYAAAQRSRDTGGNFIVIEIQVEI